MSEMQTLSREIVAGWSDYNCLPGVLEDTPATVALFERVVGLEDRMAQMPARTADDVRARLVVLRRQHQSQGDGGDFDPHVRVLFEDIERLFLG